MADAFRCTSLENTACRANSIAAEEKDLLSAPLSVAGPASSMALEKGGGGCDARGRKEAGGDNVGRPIDKYRVGVLGSEMATEAGKLCHVMIYIIYHNIVALCYSHCY